MNSLNCFRCNCPLQFAGSPRSAAKAVRNQPNDGLVFRSYGNYGSTFFDPMRESAYLEIAICDGCMRAQPEHFLASEGARDSYE